MANPLGWVSMGADLFGNLFGSIFGANKEEQLLQKQQDFQWKTMLHQNQWNEDMMYKQADLEGSQYMKYQSPSAQRRLMESAGINPFVQGSAVQPMSVSSASNASPGSSSNGLPGASGRGIGQLYQMAGGALGQALQLKADLDIKKEQAKNIAADTEEKRGRTVDPEITQAIQRMQLSASQSEAVKKGIEAQFAFVNAVTDLQGKKQAIEESKKRITKMLSDMGVNQAKIDELWASMNLKMSQAFYMDEQTTDLRETRGARINKMNSEAGVNNANKKRTETLTQAELGEIYARIDKYYEERKSMKREDALNALKVILQDSQYLDDLLKLSPEISYKHGKNSGKISLGSVDVGGLVHRITQSFDEERARKIKELMEIAFDIDKIY